MSKFKKIIKWLFIGLLLGIILLGLAIFTSSLFSYKKSDFNIPDNFFDTRFENEDEQSDENGFNDFKELIDIIEKNYENIGLEYFDNASKCTFTTSRCSDVYNFFEKEIIAHDKKSKNKIIQFDSIKQERLRKILNEKIIFLEKTSLQNEKKVIKMNRDKIGQYKKYLAKINKSNKSYLIIEGNEDFLKEYVELSKSDIERIKKFNSSLLKNEYTQFKLFSESITEQILKINSKKFIKQPNEHHGIKSYVRLLQYLRATRYLSYQYLEEGKFEKGINILLSNQEFINNLSNKSDMPLIGGLVIMTIDKINLEAIEFLLNIFDLDKKLLKKMISIMENEVSKGLVENGIKNEFNIIGKLLYEIRDPYSTEGYFSYQIKLLRTFLFYSANETDLLAQKNGYEIIINEGGLTSWSCQNNLNNYDGRKILCSNPLKTVYGSQYEKENDLVILREQIIEKLKD